MASGEQGAAPTLSTTAALTHAFDELSDRRLVLFGGKGGVGKTTVASLAALHLSRSRDVILFASDPASNLADLFGAGELPRLRVESIDATALYSRFLATNLGSFLEIGDRGTYLDRDELQRFFELSLPGIDELMAWMRIGELVEENEEALVIADTAPTGHTLRMLGAGSQFERLAEALDALAEKHRAIVRQFARRATRDAIDDFIDDFAGQAERRRRLLADPARTAFVPVMLAEPWVVAQTRRLADELTGEGVPVPFVVLNRAVAEADCACDRDRQASEIDARARFTRVVDAPRSCRPLDSIEALQRYLGGPADAPAPVAANAILTVDALELPRIVFFAGKGGVGKTTCAVSVALQLARRSPGAKYVAISVDPAHALRDVFAHEAPPQNLAVETVDTKRQWDELRERLGDDVERAVSSLTPGRMSVSYDSEAMKRLLEIGPPGADEIFSVVRLAELVADASIAGVIVDTAPTGHFLRLLELPSTAGDWVRELIRLLLRYRELVPAGALGEELVQASRALRQLDAALRSEAAGVVVVTRPERIVVAETRKLIDELQRRGLAVTATIANYVTGDSDCPCDRALRSHELAALGAIGQPLLLIPRRSTPVTALRDLERLVPVS